MGRTLKKCVLASLLVGFLTGCSTSNKTARPYDDNKIALIKRGQTTEAQLLEWFGPPDIRDVRSAAHNWPGVLQAEAMEVPVTLEPSM